MTEINNEEYELIVCGAGPAGLAAALEAWKNGLRRILMIERDIEPGGILNQCIHPGFGLQVFKEELTGPEYAQRFIREVAKTDIRIMLDTMVLELESSHPSVPANFQRMTVSVVSPKTGYQRIQTQSIILAMGCRERTRGAIAIPGDRPSGIFTAGTAQRLMNREGFMVGRKVVILGSGDIGLIMARRMTLEGAKVLAVAELMPWSNGLTRNIVQCLQDYDIPLYLSHTVTDIVGKDRLEQVTLSKVDESFKPVPGTEITFDCDTLLLSVGLIPENELSRQAQIEIDSKTSGPVVDQNRQTSVPGIFACGNVLHVHDLVDFVTKESQSAGRSAAEYVLNLPPASNKITYHSGPIRVRAGNGVGYVVPQLISSDIRDERIPLMMRVKGQYQNKEIQISCNDRIIHRYPRERLVPAEMEQVFLPASDLNDVTGELVVSLADREENK